jgi:hypothetical protein
MWIQMSLLSNHNANINSNTVPTTGEIGPEVKTTTGATTTSPLNLRVTTRPEMENFVFTAKSLTIPKKNAANGLTIKNHVSMAKDNFTGQKLTILTLKMLKPQTVIPIVKLVRFFNSEPYESPHNGSKCHSSTDFKFVYCFNRYVQQNF